MSERRIKIVGGDGKVWKEWRVLDAETGESIKGVSRVEIIADASGEAQAVLYMHPFGVEVEIEMTAKERAEELTAAQRVASEVEGRIRELIQALFHRERPS